jgi:hypothetical protein
MVAWLLLALLLLGLGAVARTATVVTGELNASEHEADEGYFAVGHDTMLVTRPGSELHSWLRSNNGRRITITIELDRTE